MGRKDINAKPGHNHNYGAALNPHWGNAGYKVGSHPGQPGTGRSGSGIAEFPRYESTPRAAGNVMILEG